MKKLTYLVLMSGLFIGANAFGYEVSIVNKAKSVYEIVIRGYTNGEFITLNSARVEGGQSLAVLVEGVVGRIKVYNLRDQQRIHLKDYILPEPQEISAITLAKPDPHPQGVSAITLAKPDIGGSLQITVKTAKKPVAVKKVKKYDVLIKNPTEHHYQLRLYGYSNGGPTYELLGRISVPRGKSKKIPVSGKVGRIEVYRVIEGEKVEHVKDHLLLVPQKVGAITLEKLGLNLYVIVEKPRRFFRRAMITQLPTN